MKKVKCKSGLLGSQETIKERYESIGEFKKYCQIYGIHKRLGYRTIKSCWESNPTIQSSVEPSDLKIVYFHVVRKKDGTFRIKESINMLCHDVKNSSASFMSRVAAKQWINTN